jgi:hypothetical protein
MSLREKAIAAYEASDLKKQDIERKKDLIREIAHFIQRLRVSVIVNDNPFRHDDLLFYASELSDSSGLYGYEVSVARQCATCKEYIELTVSVRFIEKGVMVESEDGNVTQIEFGRWLLQPHLCEFSPEQRKPVEGFLRSH